MEVAAEGFERRAEAEEALIARLVTVEAPPSPEAALARLLVERWEPVPSEEIHRELQLSGHDLSLTATRAMLRAHPGFVGVPGQGFQLGRGRSGRAGLPT
jgi:hypothetical protein